MTQTNKWPKILPPLTAAQKIISDDFMKQWHEVLASNRRYGLIEKFNHLYPIKNSSNNFLRTLEIGAGLGEHLQYERLTPEQEKNYVALELRKNLADEIQRRFPNVQTQCADCQVDLGFSEGYFDRILAIHVLEHLPNLPAALQEIHRVCDKEKGLFSVVIPCEGGAAYSLARRVSAQRIFEKRYQQPYSWFIEREHINRPAEIIHELEKFFEITHQSYFPLLLPIVNINLCIGITLRPKII